MNRSSVTLLCALLVSAWLVLDAGPGRQLAGALADTRAPDHVVIRSDKAMGTRVSVSIWTDDEAAAATAAAAVFGEFHRIDHLMTTWLEESQVSRINASAGKGPVKVSDEVLTVLDKALEVSRKSGGAFDITVGVFRGLWKFDQDRDGTIPEMAQVRARLPLVGYRHVVIDRSRKTVFLRKAGMRITLGGIAKGYALDRAVSILHGRGFVDFILQAGGDLYVSGRRGDRAWRVGIRDPRGSHDATFAIAAIEDRTFSTSGDYERHVVKDGVRYHHILDPVTGTPVRRSRSVTVLAKDAITADAWSTALFVMGVERGLPMVEKIPGLDAVFVDTNNKVHVSSGLSGKIWIHRQPTPGI
ncbi:MAG: FAD:protein FMN transferase [Proteobacteria bacterium]|nr:FAD:protein FMN transferase [Pseudomonadota bacterium]